MKYIKQKLAILTCFVTLCTTLTSCSSNTESETTDTPKETSSIFGESFIKENIDDNLEVDCDDEFEVDYETELVGDFLIQGTTLVRYLGNDKVVEVPDYITQIGDFAFDGFDYTSNFLLNINYVNYIDSTESIQGSNITKIILPETITKIGGGAFFNCTLLTEVNIPQSVTEIGAYAFNNCYSLTNIEIPPNLTEIRPYVFNNCIFLNNVTLNNNITSIGDYAFYGCTSITELEIPNSVKTIGAGAFSECVYMERIVLPDGLTYILENTFSNLKSIKEINLPDSVVYVADGAFYNFGLRNGNYTIDGFETDEYGTFINPEFNYNIFEKPLSENLKYFGSQRYESYIINYSTVSYGEFSEDLKPQTTETAEIIDGFEILDGMLVKYHGDDEIVIIPDTVKAINENAFRNNDSIKEIIVPNTIVIIRPNTFSKLNSLTTVHLPDSCKAIEKNAFYNCTALTDITIPNANFVMSEVFIGCEAIENIIIPTGMTTIPSRLFFEWNFNGEFTIPNHVTNIEEKAFAHSTGLTNITIPNSVTHIETHAFYNCENLEKATISNNLETMEINAFSNCNSLKEINIPKSIENVIDDFFQNCYNIYIVNVNENYNNQVQITENKNYIYHNLIQKIVDDNGFFMEKSNVFIDNTDAVIDFMLYDINGNGFDELILVNSNGGSGHYLSIYNSSLELIFKDFNGIHSIIANTGNILLNTYAITNEKQYLAFYDSELDYADSKGSSLKNEYDLIITQTDSSSNSSSRLALSLRNFFGLLISDKSDNSLTAQTLNLYENTTQLESFDYLNIDYGNEKQNIIHSNELNEIVYDKYSNLMQYIVDNIGIVSQTSQGEGVYDVVLADLDDDEFDELIIIYKVGDNDITHTIYYNDLQGNVYTADHFDEYTTQDLITKLGLKTQTDAESIKYYNENLLNILEVYERELSSLYSETSEPMNYTVDLNELNLSPEVAKIYIDYLKGLSKEYNLDESLIELFDTNTNSNPIMMLELLKNSYIEYDYIYEDMYENQTLYFNNGGFSDLIDTFEELSSYEGYRNVISISEVNEKTYISYYESKMEPRPKMVLSYYTLINDKLQKDFSLNQYDFHYDINSNTNNGVSLFGQSYYDEYDDFNSEGFNYKKIGELNFNNLSYGLGIPYIPDTPSQYSNYGESIYLLLNEEYERPDIIYTADGQQLYWGGRGPTFAGIITNYYTITEAIEQLEKLL